MNLSLLTSTIVDAPTATKDQLAYGMHQRDLGISRFATKHGWNETLTKDQIKIFMRQERCGYDLALWYLFKYFTKQNKIATQRAHYAMDFLLKDAGAWHLLRANYTTRVEQEQDQIIAMLQGIKDGWQPDVSAYNAKPGSIINLERQTIDNVVRNVRVRVEQEEMQLAYLLEISLSPELSKRYVRNYPPRTHAARTHTGPMDGIRDQHWARILNNMAIMDCVRDKRVKGMDVIDAMRKGELAAMIEMLESFRNGSLADTTLNLREFTDARALRLHGDKDAETKAKKIARRKEAAKAKQDAEVDDKDSDEDIAKYSTVQQGD